MSVWKQWDLFKTHWIVKPHRKARITKSGSNSLNYVYVGFILCFNVNKTNKFAWEYSNADYILVYFSTYKWVIQFFVKQNGDLKAYIELLFIYFYSGIY